MDKGGNRPGKQHVSGAAQPHTPQTVETVVKSGNGQTAASHITPDPLEFFRPKNREGDVSRYAKQRAAQGDSPSILRAWATAARLDSALWALPPIAIVAGLSWSQTGSAHLDRLLVLALGALAALAGVNLLRRVAREAPAPQQLIAVFSASLMARVGGVLLLLACIVGAFINRWAGSPGLALGLTGLVLALVYACLPALVGTLPGEELIPAVALGPLLFFTALATQTGVPASGKATPPAFISATTSWELALGFGCLIFAVVVAARLHGPEPTSGLATRILIGERGLRALYSLGIALAYLLVVLAAFGAQAPHAAIIVLLSLPVAFIPLTGVARAKVSGALRVIQPQTQRLILWFEGWLLAGLLLSGLYLHLITALHALVNGK